LSPCRITCLGKQSDGLMTNASNRHDRNQPNSAETASQKDHHGFPRRLFLLDISRGIASLAVVTWHWQMFFYDGCTPPSEFARNTQPLYDILAVFFEVGYLGVDYFFLLSGIIFFWLCHEAIQTRNLDAKRFFVNRFSRLYPLHFLTLIVVAALQILYHSREGSYFAYPFNDTYHFFLNLFLASSWGLEQGWSYNGPNWSISVEVLLYASFFLAATVIKRPWIVVTCLTISAGAYMVSLNSFNQIYRGAAEFYFGGVVFFATASINARFPQMRHLIFALTLSGWWLVFDYFYLGFSKNLLPIGTTVHHTLVIFFLFPFTLCSLILYEIHGGHSFNKMSWIGDITYSSYLLHFPLNLTLVSMVSLGCLPRGFHLNPSCFVLYFFILIAISLITFYKVERPLKNLIRQSFGFPAR
jgi:peptidoglycan/LPS O-acetylase OafA/YrhL